MTQIHLFNKKVHVTFMNVHFNSLLDFLDERYGILMSYLKEVGWPKCVVTSHWLDITSVTINGAFCVFDTYHV